MKFTDKSLLLENMVQEDSTSINTALHIDLEFIFNAFVIVDILFSTIYSEQQVIDFT